MNLDQSLNWVIEHWYYWLILVLVVVMASWYQELNRLKKQFTHWCDERLKTNMKAETKINPKPKQYLWLEKQINITGTKLKKIGLLKSFKSLPESKDDNIVTIVASTRFISFLKLALGNDKMFKFNLKNVTIDDHKNSIIVPYNYYWSLHPDGEYMLMCPDCYKSWTISNKEIDRDLKKLAIDGFASQMASFSSVKPTWGHEDNVMEKETENKFGFLDKFGRKKPTESEGN